MSIEQHSEAPSRFPLHVTRRQIYIAGAFLAVCVALIWMVDRYVPVGIDWRDVFRPAALRLISGEPVYGNRGFYNAPWILLPLVPIALLPWRLGSAVLSIVGVLAFVFVAYRFKFGPAALGVFLLSPPIIRHLIDPSLDFLVVIGFILPPQIGLFFVLAKPQIGIGLAVYWLVEAYRAGGVREVVRVFWPVSLAFLASFAVYGFWPMEMLRYNISTNHNVSFWPWSIPIGIGLIVWGILTKRMKTSLMASPFLSPYIGTYSLHVILFGLEPTFTNILLGVIGLWVWNFLPIPH
jgi:hypothetical protein